MKYSGNTIYSAQTGNSITVDVKKNETAISNLKSNSEVSIITINGKQYLKGLKGGDEVAVFDCSGKLLFTKTAKSDSMLLNFQGVGIVMVRSGNNVDIVKSVSK